MKQIWRLVTATIGAAWLMSSPTLASDLTILHMNDHHSHLQADEGVDLLLAGQPTRVRSGGFPALIAKAKALSAGRNDIVKLHAGDAITGGLNYTLFKGPDDTVWTDLDRGRTYEVITNNYIAGGRDGYVTFKTVADEGRLVDTYLDYAQSFVDYVQETGRLQKLPISDYSTQRYR